jgi:hypothetical protein
MVAILILFTEISLKQITGKGLLDRIYFSYVIIKVKTTVWLINVLVDIIKILTKSIKKYLE